MSALRTPLSRRLCHQSLLALGHSRQADAEGRALSRLAFHGNVAPHHLAEAFADREPKARAAVFAGGGGISLGEFLEQLAHLLGGHADARIGYRDGDPVAAVLLPLPRVDADRAVVGEL